jgi:hypothetical protein
MVAIYPKSFLLGRTPMDNVTLRHSTRWLEMERERILELISRGLDGDLDRHEVRLLYQLAGQEPWVREEMAAMAALADGLQFYRSLEAHLDPSHGLVNAIRERVREPAAQPIPTAWWRRLRDWWRSPHGLSLQPMSFIGGMGVAGLVLWLTIPGPNWSVLVNRTGNVDFSNTQRLAIHDVPFVEAKARVDWHNRFIIPPGDAARLALQTNADQPVHFRFETVEPVELQLAHIRPDAAPPHPYAFKVDGIGYASLRQPQRGDAVAIRNQGHAPVLVYFHAQQPNSARVFNEPWK